MHDHNCINLAALSPQSLFIYIFPGITLGTMPYVLPAVKQFLAVDGSGEVPPIGESSTSFLAHVPINHLDVVCVLVCLKACCWIGLAIWQCC